MEICHSRLGDATMTALGSMKQPADSPFSPFLHGVETRFLTGVLSGFLLWHFQGSPD
jgi:hypothetical protein